ncbi:hypothetical protein [Streptomyces sp. CRN 30]|uniref:hypothetical protein n=1 Tax=Streptomyces sp. CRN 30 TaxID=3075613 RepID=UPI002A82F6C8|nr:hypothetical protein [Streptomyces sp. CRN 30]
MKGWLAWTLLGSPVYAVARAIGTAQGLLLLVGDKKEARKEFAWALEPPCRTQWHSSTDPDVVAVDYRVNGVYHLASPWLDPRLAYAQAVLHVWDRDRAWDRD